VRVPQGAVRVSLLATLTAFATACGGGNTSNSSPSSSAPSTASAVPTANVATSIQPCPPSGAATSLTGAGSTFDAPLFSKQFDTYNTQCKVQVNYQSIGSGGGIEQVTKKTVNFGASDAPMTDDQIKAAGGDMIHIPVTLGAVSVGYNLPGVKAGVKLSGHALAKIFLGTIKKWNDPALKSLNTGMDLPDLDITVVHRSDGSGTSFIFTNYLSAVSSDWQSKVGAGTSPNWPTGAGGKGSEGVAGLVKQTPGSVGYFELAYSTQNNITTATMRNHDGEYVQPTTAGASAAATGQASSVPSDLRAILTDPPGAQAYPITGFSWLVVNQAQTDANAGKSLAYLLWWMVHAGQQYANALSYAPLPEAIVKLDEAQIKKITVGGTPVISGQ
jgi:phosphate transport system substrate-binding protein